jgi:3-hydroxyisobutyrate dehydrogenase-like beta-hydroxyacid dehydrogenase
MTERVGFAGLGFMGHGMAHNILTKGYPLAALPHRKRDAVEDLVAKGATEVASPEALAEASDVIVLCLTASPQVEAVIQAMLPALRRGHVIVDCSTSDPVSTMKLGALLHDRKAGLVDAPLGRTPKDAWEGSLDVMVGAVDGDFARVEPILKTFAGRVLRVGGPGDGHRMKLLNNFLSLSYGAVYAEALAMAGKVGIGPERFDSVIRGGRMDCGFYQTFMQYALEGNREAHRFTLQNAYKDLRYLESMANAAAVATPMASAAKNSYAQAVGLSGGGPEDYVPHLVDWVGKANGP